MREQDALILFDPGSTHNFISHELALKLGVHEFEMGDVEQANGAFKEQELNHSIDWEAKAPCSRLCR